MNLASKVKYLRKKLNMAQRDLAAKSGLSQPTVCRIESGQTRQLKSFAMLRLATALGVTVDHLLGQDGSMKAIDVLKADPKIEEFVQLYQQLDASRRDEARTYMRYLLALSQRESA